MELSHMSIVEAEVTSQPRWRRQDGGPRTWIKLEVNASAVGNEMTRKGVRGSHLTRLNRLDCAPGRRRSGRRLPRSGAIGNKPSRLAVARRGVATKFQPGR
jgi:hypothetical protein